MNVRLLIDGITRQTTVLIAQLSTTAGVRAPLAHVVDEVFRDLAAEIEAQGVGRKIVADMFGMALRSYQKKLRRLQESATDQNRTLWQAVIEFLQANSTTRSRILERFRHDGEKEVGAVLNDLVSSGLVYTTGRGDDMRYGLTTDADRVALSAAADARALANVIWLSVFLGRAQTEETLATALRVDAPRVIAAVGVLVADGRVRRLANGELEASNIVIPVGATEGWEAAVLDHYRAVTTTIARKASGGGLSARHEEVGGTTLTFSVYEGHPYEQRVRALLHTVRTDLHALWDEVSSYNAAHPVPDGAPRVTFYFGQVPTDADEPAQDISRG